MPKEQMNDKERARRRAADLNSSSWYKLKEGDNMFRPLPTPKSKKTPANWFEYNVHRDVGPKKAMVRCGKSPEDGEGDCWLCDVQIPKLRKAGKESRATALESKPQFVMQVAKVEMIDDDTPKFSGPFLFSPSKGVAGQLLSKVFGSKKRTYEDPNKGYNISLSRTGTTKNDTRYGILETDDEPSKVPAELIAKLKPFSELKEVPEYDEAKMKAAYTGTDTIDDDDDDEEDAPPPKKGSKKAPPPADDDDDDADDSDDDDESADDDDDDTDDGDDDDASDDDDDDDDAPPVTKKGKKAPPPAKKKPKPVDDDDDDDDVADDDDDDAGDDDDDEEDAPPPKKGKGKKAPPPADDDDDDAGDDDDDDAGDDDDDEEDAPPPKKGKAKPAPVDDDDDDDAPPPPKKKGPPPPPKKKVKK